MLQRSGCVSSVVTGMQALVCDDMTDENLITQVTGKGYCDNIELAIEQPQ